MLCSNIGEEMVKYRYIYAIKYGLNNENNGNSIFLKQKSFNNLNKKVENKFYVYWQNKNKVSVL